MSTLRTHNLTKSYGGRTVVKGVSLDVSSGEIVGLLGPNGAGKTTTFYMTVGLTPPDSGRAAGETRIRAPVGRSVDVTVEEASPPGALRTSHADHAVLAGLTVLLEKRPWPSFSQTASTIRDGCRLSTQPPELRAVASCRIRLSLPPSRRWWIACNSRSR